MRLEVTTTPRETLIWAPSAEDAALLRRQLKAAGLTVLDADLWELDFWGKIPEGEKEMFDPARVFDVEIGETALDSLLLLRESGHELFYHRWQGGESYEV